MIRDGVAELNYAFGFSCTLVRFHGSKQFSKKVMKLTLRRREGVKRQDVLTQMYRDPATAVDLRDVKPGQGL